MEDRIYQRDESFRNKITTVNEEGNRKWLYPKKPNGKLKLKMSNIINIVRSIKTKTYRDHDVNFGKETKWNDRFHLGKLPPYDAYKDLNSNIKIFK